jgi:hypothetical protein
MSEASRSRKQDPVQLLSHSSSPVSPLSDSEKDSFSPDASREQVTQRNVCRSISDVTSILKEEEEGSIKIQSSRKTAKAKGRVGYKACGEINFAFEDDEESENYGSMSATLDATASPENVGVEIGYRRRRRKRWQDVNEVKGKTFIDNKNRPKGKHTCQERKSRSTSNRTRVHSLIRILL